MTLCQPLDQTDLWSRDAPVEASSGQEWCYLRSAKIGLSSEHSMSSEITHLRLLYTHGKAQECCSRGSGCSKECLPTSSSYRVEAGDMGNAVQDLGDDVDLLEERMSQMSASPNLPFRFMQSS